MILPNIEEPGVDLGAVDSNTNIDWAAAKDAGAKFVYVKRMQHVYPDAQYATSSAGARAAGLVVGAYHFPGWGPRAVPAKTQISAFKSGPGVIVAGHDLPPALDFEGFSTFIAAGVPKATLVDACRQLVFEVQDQLGVRPMIYTSYNQWWDLGLPAAPWASECPLWIKTAYRLEARNPVDQVVPHEPHIGLVADDPKDYYRVPDTWAKSGWVAQQHQGDAVGFPGFSKTVDVNRFNTTRRGSKGPFVMWIQRRLAAVPIGDPYRAAPLIVDGDYGPATEAAVRAFQASRSLPVTGLVDVATFAAIAWASK